MNAGMELVHQLEQPGDESWHTGDRDGVPVPPDERKEMTPLLTLAGPVPAGVASPLERRFARRFTLSVDARAEAAARRRAEQDPVLGCLLQTWTLPPSTHTMPPVVQAILAQAGRTPRMALAA